MTLKRERAELTRKYEAGEIKFPPVILAVLCSCRSFRFPHNPEAHDSLRGDMDWRLPEERQKQSWQEWERPN